MFNRASFKKRAKEAIYHNWKSCIIICFIYTILIGGTLISLNVRVTDNKNEVINNEIESNSDVVNEFLNSLNNDEVKEPEFLTSATRGVIGSLVNNVSKSGSFLFGALNAINQALFKDRIWASAIIIVGAIISLFYWIFVSKVLEVGYARFFMENRKYTKTKANKL